MERECTGALAAPGLGFFLFNAGDDFPMKSVGALDRRQGAEATPMEILALIPARGGSKGLPGKNLRVLAGRPLIAYTIAAAQASRYGLRAVVSTDDPAIARAAAELGAEVPFLRPPDLARDETPTLPVVQHALRHLAAAEGYRPDLVVLLQPTSPLREARHIDEAIDLLLAEGAESAISLCPVEHSPFWMKTVDERGRVRPFLPGAPVHLRRQDLPPVYRPNGAIYITRPEIVLDQNRLLGDDTVAYLMAPEDSVDIDTELDLWLAEMLLQRRQQSGSR